MKERRLQMFAMDHTQLDLTLIDPKGGVTIDSESPEHISGMKGVANAS